MERKQRLAVLGATGSIGRRTLDIIQRSPEALQRDSTFGRHRVDDTISLSKQHKPRLAIIGRDELLPALRAELEPLGIKTAAGEKALAESTAADDIDTVVTATVGYSGLEPTINAIKAGKDIALANKETLVVAGHLVNELLKDSKSRLYPIDSGTFGNRTVPCRRRPC